MSRKRHSLSNVKGPDGTVLVRTYPVTFPNGYKSGTHRHEWDQLTYAARGVMTVRTESGIWVVPPHRAVWVPASTDHAEEMSGRVAARSLYLVPGLSKSLPRECSTVNVTPLLRELILFSIKLGALDAGVPSQGRLIGVILDQLEELHSVPLQLPSPKDHRAVKTANLLQQDPGNAVSLSEIARAVGASKRTIERLFRTDTGMPFNQWRQRLRLIHAMRLLAAGESVTRVALDSGYGSTSAFIAMFKKTVGTTPSRYFDAEDVQPTEASN